MGVPEVWVSDTASHFKNRVMKTLEGALRVEHRFTVANLPWSNGTCERMMRDARVEGNFAGGEARYSRVGGRGASGPVGSEHGLSREICKHTVARHVRAGAVDKFLDLGFADWRRLESECTRSRGFMEEDDERCEGSAMAALGG